jgi:hypothetical protein
VLGQADCVRKYSKDQVTEYMLCAASPGADACYGDSGGPFIMKASSNVVFIKIFLGVFFIFSYSIQHCFICRPSDSTVPTDAGIEPRTVATGALTVRRSIH